VQDEEQQGYINEAAAVGQIKGSTLRSDFVLLTTLENGGDEVSSMWCC